METFFLFFTLSIIFFYLIVLIYSFVKFIKNHKDDMLRDAEGHNDNK